MKTQLYRIYIISNKRGKKEEAENY